jgi:cytoskeletal protein CcmA (bactofilin family)
MLGSKKNSNNTPQSTVAEGQTCIIARGTSIEGKISTSENMRIDGTIKGDVLCEKRLVMDTEGFIKGNVKANAATIKGKVEGIILIEDTLHLLDSSYVKGSIKAKQLKVEEGAKYEGELKVG